MRERRSNPPKVKFRAKKLELANSVSVALCVASVAMAVPQSSIAAVFELSALNGLNGFVINGIDSGDASGRSVSNAGDINGDGKDDLIIGARFADPNGNSGAGESYVVFGGGRVGSVGMIELSDLDGSDGFVINGIDSSDRSGGSVSGAGDINGDGMDDLIIGARYADPNGNGDAGESYVVLGGVSVGGLGTIELSDLDGTDGFVINGADSSDRSGGSVSGAGDINGDGMDDLIIGALAAAPNGNTSAGESYVVFGGVGVGSVSAVELSDLDGSDGFVINGIDPGGFSGRSVSSAGDINGDGIDDLVIGAPNADPNGNNSGESYVVFGGVGVGVIELSDLDGTDGFVINGIYGGNVSGNSVSGAGDINGDGMDDLIIGAPLADPNGNESGESYVVFGGGGAGGVGIIELSDLDGSDGFVINGIDSGDFSGVVVSGAGDINGDGMDDLIIGALLADPNGSGDAGESYVVFGGESVGSLGAIELSDLDGSDGFVINGIDSVDRSGYSVSGAGDINGDGIDDLIIGAPLADPNGSESGESYVVFGRAVELCNGLAVNINLNFNEVPNGNSNVVLGTSGDDDIRGRAGNDTICGMGGDDFIHGNSGDDWIGGGDGVDNIRGGQGNDVLYTGSGATVGTSSIVFGGNGDDEINGGVDADDLRGGGGIDIINGNEGDDELTGNADEDILNGGPGDDELRGGQGDDVLSGESGDDFLSGGGGLLDTCDGGSGTGDFATPSCETVTNIP